MIVQRSCYPISYLLLSVWCCMTWTIFVHSRCSAHSDAPTAGGMCGFSGGSATTGHIHILHTAQWDSLAESRANAMLNSQSLKLRAASWAPWRSWGMWATSASRQVRHRWLWNRACQHCHQNMELDRLQSPHSAFKQVFVCAAQLLASLVFLSKMRQASPQMLSLFHTLQQSMRFLLITPLGWTRWFQWMTNKQTEYNKERIL